MTGIDALQVIDPAQKKGCLVEVAHPHQSINLNSCFFFLRTGCT
jgi:hypothetical protein